MSKAIVRAATGVIFLIVAIQCITPDPLAAVLMGVAAGTMFMMAIDDVVMRRKS